MELHFHPAKKRPKTALVLAFGLGILIQALWQWLNPAVALALWVALVLSLRDFFAPSTYRFTEQGLTIHGILRAKKTYPWRRFRAYIKDRNGVFLTPYKQKRASENSRGVFLPLLAEQKEQVEHFISAVGLEKR